MKRCIGVCDPQWCSVVHLVKDLLIEGALCVAWAQIGVPMECRLAVRGRWRPSLTSGPFPVSGSDGEAST